MVAQKRKPHQFKKKKPFYRRRYFWLGLLFIFIIAVFFYFIFIHDFFQIKTIESVGYSNTEIESLAWEKIEKDFILFSSKSIFLVRLNEIEEATLNKFPQLAEVKMSRNFPDKIVISATERSPVFILCPFFEEMEETESDSQNCFILDKKGIAFRQEPFSGQELLLVRKALPPNSQSFLGDNLVEEDDLDKIAWLYSYFAENLKIELKEVSIFPEKLSALTAEGWEAYFNLSGDVNWQAEKLKALLQDKIPKERREFLEYIELRFGNFANPKYYK